MGGWQMAVCGHQSKTPRAGEQPVAHVGAAQGMTPGRALDQTKTPQAKESFFQATNGRRSIARALTVFSIAMIRLLFPLQT
jgi:hypothetical protein